MPALPPAIPKPTSAAAARRMTSDERAVEAAERVGDDLLSPETVKLSAGLDAATSVQAVLEAADDVVQFAGFGSLPAAAPSIVCDAVSVNDRFKILSNDVFKNDPQVVTNDREGAV